MKCSALFGSFISQAQGVVLASQRRFVTSWTPLLLATLQNQNSTRGSDETEDTLMKVRAALDSAIPDKDVDYPEESVDDFHPLIIKRLLGIDEDKPHEVLDDVTPPRMRARMSKPFEAAMRHFNTADAEHIYATAVFTFLQTRKFLREIWKPFPGDYWRILSLVPNHATGALKSLYDAMLEDYGPVPSDAKTTDSARVPGGGHPKYQDKLIKGFEKKHEVMLLRVEHRMRAVSEGEEENLIMKQAKFKKAIIPLDMNSPESVIAKLLVAIRGQHHSQVITLFDRFYELKAVDGANRSEIERMAVGRGLGKASRSSGYMKALINLHGPEKAFDMVRTDKRVNKLSAGSSLIRHNRDLGLELFAIWRSQQTDLQQLIGPTVVMTWAKVIIKSSPHIFTFILGIVFRMCQENALGSPNYSRNAFLLYKIFLYFDSSYKASTNSFGTERGRMLSRAADTPRQNWGNVLSRPLATRTITRVFNSELKTLRDIPHPFAGVVTDLSLPTLVLRLARSGCGVVIMDTNMCDTLFANPKLFLKRVTEYAATVSGKKSSKIARFKVIFPWVVLAEMDTAMKYHNRGRYNVHRSFSKYSNNFITLRANADALCVSMTPTAHLYGVSNLGVRDRQIANVALSVDFIVRSARAIDNGALQSGTISLEDEDTLRTDDSDDIAAGNGSDRTKSENASTKKSAMDEYWHMHVQRCLDLEKSKLKSDTQQTLKENWQMLNRGLRHNEPLLFPADEQSEVVVATEDVELARYLQAAGITTYPPRQYASEGEADVTGKTLKPETDIESEVGSREGTTEDEQHKNGSTFDDVNLSEVIEEETDEEE